MPRIATNVRSPTGSHEVDNVRRKHFAGTTSSNSIGPVSFVSETDSMTWKRTVKAKREIYGKDNRIAPGGRTPGIDHDTAKKLIRKDDDIEPVFYWSYPSELLEDILRCFSARMVVGLTVGDGAIALAAMILNKPFVGICLTTEHRNGVRLHLANHVFMGFMTEGNHFYDARIAGELEAAGITKTNATGIAVAKPAAKPQAKKASKPAPKPGNDDDKEAAAPAQRQAAQQGASAQPASKKPKADIAANMKRALAALSQQQDGEGAGDDGDDAADDPGEDE